jgi:acyl-coenzyme A thioesterase PaaI-like protein
VSFREKLFSNPKLFKRVMSLYPPFLGAGVRVTHVADDFSEVVVELRMSPFNRNAFGTHFGGSLYAMTDPFFALMMFARLGKGYLVWDKSAQIDFVRPGTGVVTASFRLSEEQFAEARAATQGGDKFEPVYQVEVKDAKGKVVARVNKTLYIRLRKER